MSGCAELDRVPLGPEPSVLPMNYTPMLKLVPSIERADPFYRSFSKTSNLVSVIPTSPSETYDTTNDFPPQTKFIISNS
jgi:hypothetical protein